MNFYFDDYNVITSDDFNGKAIFLDGAQEHGLVFFHNSCTLPIEISLRKKYYIQIDDATYPVEYRFIVHTAKV